MSLDRIRERDIEVIRGMVWSYDHYCPHAARRLIDAVGPFPGLSVEESVNHHTEQLRRAIVTEGLDVHAEIEGLRDRLKEYGYEPAPAPWMPVVCRAAGPTPAKDPA
jgi:hypothetical protein